MPPAGEGLEEEGGRRGAVQDRAEDVRRARRPVMPIPRIAAAPAGEMILGYVLRDPRGQHGREPEYPTPQAAWDAVRGQPSWRVGAVAADGSIRFDDAA